MADNCNDQYFGSASQTRTPNEAWDAKHGQYKDVETQKTDKGASPETIPTPFKTRGA